MRTFVQARRRRSRSRSSSTEWWGEVDSISAGAVGKCQRAHAACILSENDGRIDVDAEPLNGPWNLEPEARRRSSIVDSDLPPADSERRLTAAWDERQLSCVGERDAKLSALLPAVEADGEIRSRHEGDSRSGTGARGVWRRWLRGDGVAAVRGQDAREHIADWRPGYRGGSDGGTENDPRRDGSDPDCTPVSRGGDHRFDVDRGRLMVDQP